jgi:branched-chain amino acid transport system substrate-binding protein
MMKLMLIRRHAFRFTILAIQLFFSVSAHAGRPVEIGALMGFTGAYRTSHIHTFRAMKMAVNQINAAGGILGRKLVLVRLDNRSSPLGSIKAAQSAVKKGIIAVIGPIRSSNAIAAAPVLQAARIIMITPTSTSPDVTKTGSYIFRTCYTDKAQGLVMADFACDDLKLKKAVVLTNTDNRYSIGLAGYIIDRFRAKGGIVLWEGDYLDKISDFGQLIQKVKMLDPDVIFIPGYSRDAGMIVKKSRQMDLKSVFIGGDGWDELIYHYAGNAINGCFHTAFWHPDLPGRKNRDFVEQYRKQYGEIKRFDSASAYDAVMILAVAIKKAGCLEPEKIRQAMMNINFTGAGGPIRFDRNGDPVKPVVIIEYRNNKSYYLKIIQQQ